MPKISLSTWSLFLKMDYQHAMQFAIKNGFQGIEFWSNPIDFWPSRITPKEIDVIKSIALEHHIPLAVHFCYGSNNLADLNERHLQVCMEQLKETIRLCQRIGAEIVVIHPGTIPDFLPIHKKGDLNPRFTLKALRQDSVGRFKKSLAEATLFAEKHHVMIGLENLGHNEKYIQSSVEDLAEWVDQIASPSLQITLDVGHANLGGGVKKAIKILGSRIKHVHLDDNNGMNSNHGELGTGTIDWEANASFLRSFHGMLSLEVRGDDDPEGTVLKSKSFLEKLLGQV